MSVMMNTYEIRRRIIGQIIEHLSWKDGFGEKHFKEMKMFHVEARTPDQAIKKSEKYGGELVSCRKADKERITGLYTIERLHLNQEPPVMYLKGNPYKSAIAMESMIWQKRNVRRKKMDKDKESD
jgi:hypothetical protein